jgi:predicted ATP-binding protein involved in virulence
MYFAQVKSGYQVLLKRLSMDYISFYMVFLVGLTLCKRKTMAMSGKTKNIETSYLNSIKIKNYFSIKNIEITDLKDKKEIYFVGENGDGKTILLQAILLALKKEYSGFVREYIEQIEQDMVLFVKDEISIEYIGNLNLKNIFAYGINRNKIHYNDFDKYGYGGLFDTSDSRKTTYLKDPFYELGKKYKGRNPVVKEFIQILNQKILRENYKIFDGGDVNFIELSEGYKSTVIWLYDLVSRLIENQKNIKKLKDFKAIVLIDEVDLYLHPKWKYNFVYTLREVFPQIQFIMITHSMVTILGAREDAIFYKVYKEDGETKISQPLEHIKNLMANNLSTSPLFDMETARARNSDDKLETGEAIIYTKIHQIVSKQMKGKKAIIEDEIVDLINKELDDYLKEHDL